MSDWRPARTGERQVPYWEALLLAGLRAVSRPLARRHQRTVQGPRRVFMVPSRAHGVARDVAVTAAVMVFLAAMLVPAIVTQIPPTSSWPTSSQPPVQICGNSTYLNGPSSAPAGAVTVPAGDNSALFQYALPANTTYWFAPGTHTIATGLFGAFDSIGPGNNDVLIGAPGAILDGGAYNYEAIAGNGTNVTVEYLTIQNFHTPGGQGAVTAGVGWTVQNDTIQNTVPGSGLYLGTGDNALYNCITQNGQQGFAAYSASDVSTLTGGVSNVDVNDNEISYNDTCNWEVFTSFPITPPSGCAGAGQFSGCGCSGAGKFWESDVSQFEDNYVHDDYSAGPWWDTNNTGATVTGNYIAREYAVSLIYEISYNGYIAGNTFVDDAWGIGPNNPGFPSSAIYINASGSDPRVPGPFGQAFVITGNSFIDDWGGVVLYETADRFCSSVANTSTGECTLVNPGTANLTTCARSLRPPSRPVTGPIPPSRRSRGSGGGASQGQGFQYLINNQPYISDCRWKTQNVQVSGNLFYYSPGEIGATCTTGNYCGFNGLFSNYGVTPPYLGYYTANNITYSQNDLFTGNTYCGPWQFDAYAQGNDFSYATWQGSPYSQDPGSTLNGPSCYGSLPLLPGMGNRTITVPARTGRR